MDDVVIVQIVHSHHDLLDSLRCVLFCKLSLVADAVEELPTGGQLRDNVEFVLRSLSDEMSYNGGREQRIPSLHATRTNPRI